MKHWCPVFKPELPAALSLTRCGDSLRSGQSYWLRFISQQLDIDQLDDNDLTTKLANFGVALSVYIQENVIFQKFMTANLDFYVGGTGANDTNPGTS
jgi:hypothetical protein